MRSRTGFSVLATVLVTSLATVLTLASAAPAQAAGRKAAVSDPVGDTVSDPLAGYTVQGPAQWADLTGASFELTRCSLQATLSTVDVPEGRGAPVHRVTWFIKGTVVREGGRKKEFTVLIDDADSVVTFIDGGRCTSTSAIDPTADTVVLRLKLSRCAADAVRVTVRAEATVNSSKPEANPNGSLSYDNRPAFLDATADTTLTLRRGKR